MIRGPMLPSHAEVNRQMRSQLIVILEIGRHLHVGQVVPGMAQSVGIAGISEVHVGYVDSGERSGYWRGSGRVCRVIKRRRQSVKVELWGRPSLLGENVQVVAANMKSELQLML